MQWLQPWSFLWAAFLIPGIIFLYFLKRRYTDRTIPSTQLWRRAMQQMEVTRPWQKLQRHLLLLLQLLAAALLIAALARPAVPSEGVTATHTILLMDTSGSMLTQEEKMNRLQKAKKEAIQLAHSLRGEQTMTIVQAGDPPRVIISESSDSGSLEQHLSTLETRYDLGDPVQSLSLARALASRHENSEVILISDGNGWDVEASVAPDRFIAIGEKKQNMSIAQLVVIDEGQSVEGMARLENHGTDPLSGTLSLYDEEDNVLDTQAVEVEGGRSHVISWQELPLTAYYRAELDVAHDALAADNISWAIPTTKATRQALYVGEGNVFLAKALRLNQQLNLVETTAEETDRYLEGGHYPLIIDARAEGGLPQTGNGLFFHPTADFAGWNWGREEQPQKTIKKADHPTTEHISLQDMYVAEARALEVPPGWQTVVRSGDLPLIVAGDLDGQRHVVFTFDLQQSDLPLRPEFPVLMHQIVDWLMPQERAQLFAAELGKQAVIPVADGSPTVTVKTPSGKEDVIEAASFNAVYTPYETGLYEVRTEATAHRPHYFSVPFPGSGMDIVPNPNVPTQHQAENRPTDDKSSKTGVAEIGRWLALAVLALLGVEWVVFTRGH